MTPVKVALSCTAVPVVTLLAERCVVVVVVQVGPVIMLSSKDTLAPDSAKNRPFKVAPVCIALAPVCDKTVPMNEVVVARVVELPTLHQTLQGSPPVTVEPVDVMSVDTDLKIHTPVFPVRVRFPDSEKALVEQ